LFRAHVQITECDDVGEAGLGEIIDDFRAAVADADAGEVHFGVRRTLRLKRTHAERQDGTGGERGLEEMAP